MERCPNCGSVLGDQRSRFCNQCGYDLRQTAESPQEETSGEQEQSANNHDDVSPTHVLPKEVSQRHGDSAAIVELHINTNQFYMEGFTGVLDTEVKNVSKSNIDSVEIEVSGSIFARSETAAFRLGAGETTRRRFQIEKLKTGGIELIHFRITARQADVIYEYRAEATLGVQEKVEDIKDIQIHAGSLLNLGQESEKFNIGGVINVNIADMIKSGRIKTANDFMREYEKLPPAFSPLILELQGTQIATANKMSRFKPLFAVVIILALAAIAIGIRLFRQAEKTSEDLQQPSAIKTEKEQNNITAGAQESIAAPMPQKSAESNEPNYQIINTKVTSPLDEARDFAKRGYLEYARKLVTEFLKANPDNEEAKALLSEIEGKINAKNERDRKKQSEGVWY